MNTPPTLYHYIGYSARTHPFEHVTYRARARYKFNVGPRVMECADAIRPTFKSTSSRNNNYRSSPQRTEQTSRRWNPKPAVKNDARQRPAAEHATRREQWVIDQHCGRPDRNGIDLRAQPMYGSIGVL